MATPAETQKASNNKNRIIIIIGTIVIVLLLAVIAFLLSRPSLPLIDIDDGNVPLSYSMEAKVMLDQDSLQAAVDEAMRNAKNSRVALEYQNNAYSTDGQTFSCYIVNSANNLYDMFLAMYADADMTDQIFLSGLVPPGSGFDQITLDRALEAGVHTVYVALTQVATEEDGTQVIKNQVFHTIKFHVS